MLTLEGVLKLDAPFSLCVVQLEHGDSHDKNQDGGDELEYSFPELFRFFIEV